jgi:hypothetical protein
MHDASRRFSSEALDIARIDLRADRAQAARAGQLLSDAFLSAGVDEPFAYYIEPDIRRLKAKLPAHYVALNDCIVESGGACAIVRDACGGEVGVMTWSHPAAAQAVSKAARQQAEALYEHRLLGLWGPEAASRYRAGCRAMEAEADAVSGAAGERTLAIKLCVVAPRLIGQGAGAAMLERFLADPGIAQGATHVMACTETTRFWQKIGMDQVGPDIDIPPDGPSPGFSWRVHKGRLAHVVACLRALVSR